MPDIATGQRPARLVKRQAARPSLAEATDVPSPPPGRPARLRVAGLRPACRRRPDADPDAGPDTRPDAGPVAGAAARRGGQVRPDHGRGEPAQGAARAIPGDAPYLGRGQVAGVPADLRPV